MATFSWLVSTPDTQHKVDVDQNMWTGGITIKVDDQPLDKRAVTKRGRVREFLIGRHNASIKMKSGLIPTFELTVDGQLMPTLTPPIPMPWWGWIFVVACLAIPVVTIGGAIPGAIGVGGAAGVYSVARNPGMNIGLRFFACLGIAVVCWGLLFALGLATAGLLSR